MNITVDDILEGYAAEIARLTQAKILAEVQVGVLEKRVAELESNSKETA